MESLASLQPYVYDHVPTLRELLPTNGGVPGIEYIQVVTDNARPAQDAGWLLVDGAKIFSIQNPNDPDLKVDVILACKGQPVRGASPHEGARVMNLDHDIYRRTKMWLGKFPEDLQQEFKLDEYGNQPEDVEVETAEAAPKQEVPMEPTPSATSATSKPASLSDEINAVLSKD